MMTVLYIIEVAFGVGLLIFIHELGHFLMARKVGVRVEVFALGFGPRLVGFRKGPTDYRISLFPFGGYVKMAGGETPSTEGTFLPDEFPSKSVGQRALIISGGVVMNFLLGILLFILAFAFGVKFVLPVAGTVVPGSDAQAAGILEGDRIVSVNGRSVTHFRQLALAIAFSGEGEDVEIVVERRGGEGIQRVPITVQPEKNPLVGYPELSGLHPPVAPVIASVDEDSPAAKAALASDGVTPFPIRVGDVITGVAGVPIGPLDGVEVMRAIYDRPGEEVRIRIRRGVEIATIPERDDGDLRHHLEFRGGEDHEVIIRPEGKSYHAIGAYPRDHAEVAREPAEGSPCFGILRMGDKIIRVQGEDGRIRSLRQATPFSRGLPIEITVKRGEEEIDVTVTPRFFGGGRRYMMGVTDFSEPVVGRVDPGSPAEQAGLRPGDVIQKVNGRDRESWSVIESDLALLPLVQSGPVKLEIEREGETLKLEVTPTPREEMTFGSAGTGLRYPHFSLRSANLVEATRFGVRGTIDWTGRIFLTIRSIASRRVHPKNIGGPVMIAESSYQFAKQGFGTILYFLGIISVNLAILNILPIPILDGGLLFFLLIEKLKGSPVKEKYLVIANYVGLALLLTLMLYVTSNDILRLINR